MRPVLFAEMVRHRDWRTRTLRELGGMEGIGEMFLEESFSARSAPLPHRVHQRAAQAVLQALLPDSRSDIRDRIKPVGLFERRRDILTGPPILMSSCIFSITS